MLDTKPETRGGVGPGETDVQGCSGLGCGEEEEKEILGSLAWWEEVRSFYYYVIEPSSQLAIFEQEKMDKHVYVVCVCVGTRGNGV